MSLRHTVRTTDPASTDADRLSRVTSLAQRLQESCQEQVSPEQLRAIGEEIGVGPAFMEEALRQLARDEEHARLRRDREQEFRQLMAGWSLAALGCTAALGAALFPPALPAVQLLLAPLLAAGIGFTMGKPRPAMAAAIVLAIALAAAQVQSSPTPLAGWLQGLSGLLAGVPVAAWIAGMGVRLRDRYFPEPPAQRVVPSALMDVMSALGSRSEGSGARRFSLSVDVAGVEQIRREASGPVMEYTFGRLGAWVEEVMEQCGGECSVEEDGSLTGRFATDQGAVAAARQLQEGCERFNTDWNRLAIPLRLRCGIALEPAGEAAGQESGSLRAADLRERAEPGDILLADELAAAGLVELGALAPLSREPGAPRLFSWQAGLRIRHRP